MYITTTINRDDVDIEIEVELSYRRGSPPSYYHPGDPDEVEVESIFPEGIVLTNTEEEEIIALAFKKIEEDRTGYYEDPYNDND